MKKRYLLALVTFLFFLPLSFVSANHQEVQKPIRENFAFNKLVKTSLTNVPDESSLKGIPGEIELGDDKNIAAWQKLQYGMFIHWGLYSELGGVWNGEPVTIGYSEQIQMWANISEPDYLKVAKRFSAEKFNPKEICSLARDAGMEYIVVTSKHHDGFSMFDTNTTEYDIVDSTPYGKDPLKLLANECRSQGLKFGVYFSLVDWHQGHEFDFNNNNPIPKSMEPIIEEQLRELMTNYGPIAEVWFDMSSPTAAQSKKFAGIVHELQPEAAVNSRVWNNAGDFRTLGDNEIPSVTIDGAWQTPASIYNSTWGYRSWQKREDLTGKIKDLVKGLSGVRANEGNYLLNIGPRGDGSVVDFETDVLRGIGSWLDRHPEAIKGASGTKFSEQTWGEVTFNDDDLFLHVSTWPKSGEITLPGLATEVHEVVEDGASKKLDWRREGNDLVITLPEKPMDTIMPVIRVKLAGPFRIIPERTIAEYADDTWIIDSKDMYQGHSYADQGSYYSTRMTTVRQTAYLATQQDGRVSLKLKGDADPKGLYRIQLGSQSRVVTGEQLTDSVLGTFEVPANQVIPFTITRDEPKFAGEDLDLKLVSVLVFSGVTSASDIKKQVDLYDEKGEFTNDDVPHSLKLHLTAVSQYEGKSLAGKVLKHMKGFKLLLDHQHEKQKISDKAFMILKESADQLIEKWK